MSDAEFVAIVVTVIARKHLEIRVTGQVHFTQGPALETSSWPHMSCPGCPDSRLSFAHHLHMSFGPAGLSYIPWSSEKEDGVAPNGRNDMTCTWTYRSGNQNRSKHPCHGWFETAYVPGLGYWDVDLLPWQDRTTIVRHSKDLLREFTTKTVLAQTRPRTPFDPVPAECTPEERAACDDGNPCTRDTCRRPAVCIHVPDDDAMPDQVDCDCLRCRGGKTVGLLDQAKATCAASRATVFKRCTARPGNWLVHWIQLEGCAGESTGHYCAAGEVPASSESTTCDGAGSCPHGAAATSVEATEDLSCTAKGGRVLDLKCEIHCTNCLQ
jgi:hypothetical protein